MRFHTRRVSIVFNCNRHHVVLSFVFLLFRSRQQRLRYLFQQFFARVPIVLENAALFLSAQRRKHPLRVRVDSFHLKTTKATAPLFPRRRRRRRRRRRFHRRVRARRLEAAQKRSRGTRNRRRRRRPLHHRLRICDVKKVVDIGFVRDDERHRAGL